MILAALCSIDLWVAIYLLGAVAAWLGMSPRVSAALKNPWLRTALLLAALLAVNVRGKDLESTYFLFGLSALIFVLAVPHSPLLLRLLDVKWTARLGRSCMAILLIHPLTFTLLGPVCFSGLTALPYPYAFLVSWAACAVAIIAVSFPLTAVLDGGSRLALELSQMLYKKANALWQRLPAARSGQ